MSDTIRAVQIDLDRNWWFSIYNENNGENIQKYRQELRNFIEQSICDADANTVYLQAFSENEDGNNSGNNKCTTDLFFELNPSQQTTSSKKIAFKEAIEMIKEMDDECKVLAWIPTLNVEWLTRDQNNLVVNDHGKRPGINELESVWYRRGSPFSNLTLHELKKVYSALGRVSPDLDGVMFHDDAFLSNWEDFSAYGRAVAKRYHALDNTLSDWLRNQEGDEKNIAWQKSKVHMIDTLLTRLFETFESSYEDEFPEEYEERMENENYLIQARDLYAAAIDKTALHHGPWYGQDIELWLEHCDQIVVMAYPDGSENTSNRRACEWLAQLVDKAQDRDLDMSKIVFKIDSCGWETASGRHGTKISNLPLSEEILLTRIHALKHAGALNVGVYPQLDSSNLFSLRDD